MNNRRMRTAYGYVYASGFSRSNLCSLARAFVWWRFGGGGVGRENLKIRQRNQVLWGTLLNESCKLPKASLRVTLTCGEIDGLRDVAPAGTVCAHHVEAVRARGPQ